MKAIIIKTYIIDLKEKKESDQLEEANKNINEENLYEISAPYLLNDEEIIDQLNNIQQQVINKTTNKIINEGLTN